MVVHYADFADGPFSIDRRYEDRCCFVHVPYLKIKDGDEKSKIMGRLDRLRNREKRTLVNHGNENISWRVTLSIQKIPLFSGKKRRNTGTNSTQRTQFHMS